MAVADPMVIVGGGLAGAKAAETLRGEGYDGGLVIVTEETERPYERPPLSKDYLIGAKERDVVYVHDAGWYAAHDVDLRTGVRAVGLDPAGHTVELDSGDRLSYRAVLLATGAAPRRLRVPGADLEGVLTLRTAADSDRLKAELAPGDRQVVVVGAGWIGLEVAAAARSYGNAVTVIEPQATPLRQVLGDEMGTVFARLHRDHGVDLRLSTGVGEFRGDGRVEAVVTADGTEVPADLVVVGVGVVPRTELAEAAGLAVDNGVVVDAALRASAPDVFAAGDIASWLNPLYGRHIRVEHWANALNGGPVAARAMLGRDVVYDRLPYFFTDQYDLGMEYSGLGGADLRVVTRGRPEDGEFVAFWLDGDRVRAAMNVNVWDVTDPLQALIRAGRPVDDARLADADIPLKDLVPAEG
jgi:3-phenylpropionate/trans-cinnamate dioxygenase ferredoxin reductase component